MRALSSAPSTGDAPVLLSRRGRVATVTLNNPSALNALSAPMGDAFGEVVRELAEGAGSEELGAVVVTGAGRAFSAGGDIKFLREVHGAHVPRCQDWGRKESIGIRSHSLKHSRSRGISHHLPSATRSASTIGW